MAAKGQVEQIVTTDDAAAGGVAHSVECPQVNTNPYFCLLAGRESTCFSYAMECVVTSSCNDQSWQAW